MYIGTDRRTSLRVGWTLVIIGLIIMPDLIFPTFTDILNFIIAMPLSELTGLSYTAALFVTWAFGIFLFMLGVLVLPYNTVRFLKSRLKGAYRAFLARPYMIVIMLIALWVMWRIADWVYITQYPQMEAYAMGVYEQYKWIIGL